MDAGFDASFASLALFPDVMSTLADNMDWTKELGTAYLSDQKGVMASIQRLRTQAKNAGNLKTNEQQKVTVESEGGSQVIVIEPANPQVVYVPAYDPQVVYTSAPPPQQSGSGGGAVAAALIGFGLGVAVGAAIDNDPYYYGPYGWGAWGFGWHGGGVYYQRSVWVVPVRPRYPYVRPVPGYRPRPNVYAPRQTNVNINVDRSRTNIGNNVNIGNKTNNVDRSRTNVGDRTTNVGDKNVNVGDRNVGNRDTPAIARPTRRIGRRRTSPGPPPVARPRGGGRQRARRAPPRARGIEARWVVTAADRAPTPPAAAAVPPSEAAGAAAAAGPASLKRLATGESAHANRLVADPADGLTIALSGCSGAAGTRQTRTADLRERRLRGDGPRSSGDRQRYRGAPVHHGPRVPAAHPAQRPCAGRA